MKLIKATVENFASYLRLEFNYSDNGLTLIQGPTGAGKSTLQDIACWILFGETAKNGLVDEVRSWGSLDSPTKGKITVDTPSGLITIFRMRGLAHQNDLTLVEEENTHLMRGSSINETQKIINERLGIDFELYCTAAYFNEFSPTSQFFSAKPEVKRIILESIAPLELPMKLSERASNERKKVKERLKIEGEAYSRTAGRLDQLMSSLRNADQESTLWKKQHSSALDELKSKIENFNQNKEKQISEITAKSIKFEHNRAIKISNIYNEMYNIECKLASTKDFDQDIAKLRESLKCESCGSFKKDDQHKIDELTQNKFNNQRLRDKLQILGREFTLAEQELNVYYKELENIKSSENNLVELLEREKTLPDPFINTINNLKGEIKEAEVLCSTSSISIESLKKRYEGLAQLKDLTFNLRQLLLLRSVKSIEESTNKYLERFFDSELSISFDLTDLDDRSRDLVLIHKNGYQCSYRQLSKGQRGLLRLCFGAAVMEASANKAGIHFNELFFDEALDGLDSELKVKAYQLFEELSKSHDSVFVIDHSVELQSLFSKKYQVKLVGDHSEIEEES